MSLIRVDLPGRSVLKQDQDKRYTSEQRQDYSVSAISDDKKKSRSRESSRRRVQRPRSSSRREVQQRSDRDKKTESRSLRESYLVVTITVSIDDEGDHTDDGYDGDDSSDSDDDSWEHEELPAVPLETPTLEGPALFPDLPQDTTVLHIPGKKAKRPGSSLEEKLEIRETSPKATGNSPKVPQSKKVKYDIVPEVNKMSKEDQIDLDLEDSLYLDLEDNVVLDSEDEIHPDLEDEIANLPTDCNSFDAHESLNDHDDLLLTLEEMINN